MVLCTKTQRGDTCLWVLHDENGNIYKKDKNGDEEDDDNNTWILFLLIFILIILLALLCTVIIFLFRDQKPMDSL